MIGCCVVSSPKITPPPPPIQRLYLKMMIQIRSQTTGGLLIDLMTDDHVHEIASRPRNLHDNVRPTPLAAPINFYKRIVEQLNRLRIRPW
eukprot:scaffold10334_cov54-Cyclotella_meneghiniana.AAC.7